MMVRDDRLYAFIIDRTNRSRSRIRRVSLRKRWLAGFTVVAALTICSAVYGVYSACNVTQHRSGQTRIERENAALKHENEQQREQLRNLNNRVEAVEEASRRLAHMSGVENKDGAAENGAGGPALPPEHLSAGELEQRTVRVERELLYFEDVLRKRESTPSIWPVEGRLTDSFGNRRDPFGGGSAEFHSGQDIATAWGSEVVAAAGGQVVFAGWQIGYGQVVVLDHGDGLTTRYGHLSRLDVAVGQYLKRGELLGRVGSTGRSTGPHLHYEVRINDQPIDPRQFLPQLPD